MPHNVPMLSNLKTSEVNRQLTNRLIGFNKTKLLSNGRTGKWWKLRQIAY
ncbi:MAG: hypothetical protein ACTS7I_02425 [Candidatus Hodgkinia cicadicola]